MRARRRRGEAGAERPRGGGRRGRAGEQRAVEVGELVVEEVTRAEERYDALEVAIGEVRDIEGDERRPRPASGVQRSRRTAASAARVEPPAVSVASGADGDVEDEEREWRDGGEEPAARDTSGSRRGTPASPAASRAAASVTTAYGRAGEQQPAPGQREGLGGLAEQLRSGRRLCAWTSRVIGAADQPNSPPRRRTLGTWMVPARRRCTLRADAEAGRYLWGTRRLPRAAGLR